VSLIYFQVENSTNDPKHITLSSSHLVTCNDTRHFKFAGVGIASRVLPVQGKQIVVTSAEMPSAIPDGITNERKTANKLISPAFCGIALSH